MCLNFSWFHKQWNHSEIQCNSRYVSQLREFFYVTTLGNYCEPLFAQVSYNVNFAEKLIDVERGRVIHENQLRQENNNSPMQKENHKLLFILGLIFLWQHVGINLACKWHFGVMSFRETAELSEPAVQDVSFTFEWVVNSLLVGKKNSDLHKNSNTTRYPSAITPYVPHRRLLHEYTIRRGLQDGVCH